ncbi:MAG: hypothetical protein HYX67_03990 [Candidatus Melainabacteria bacterium]|nr:hypothetical protein [Candidatus Melainabacteria bacterium]
MHSAEPERQETIMIVCSCNKRTDRELLDEAQKGTLWRDAVQNLPVSNADASTLSNVHHIWCTAQRRC